MPFIYKPFRQTMSPYNITLNPAVNNTFSLNISGQVCNGYRFRVFDMNSVLISSASTNLVMLGSPLYDNDTLNIVVNAGLLTAGNQYKWQVDLYSTFLTVSSVSIANDTITVTNHNLVSGDMIYIQSTGTLPVAYDYAPNWSTGTLYVVDDTVFYVTNSTYYKCKINHTSHTNWVLDYSYAIGDRVFYVTNSTYYKCKSAHISSASILPTNVTYWDVDSTPLLPTNTTYWDVVTASGLTTYTKYYVRPYDKDNLLLYDNIEASKNNQGNLNITSVGSGTIKISNIGVSDEIPFMVYGTATVVLTVGTVTSQSKEFIPTYTHPQNVLVNKFQAFLYSSNSELLDSSDLIYSSNVKYSFDGFLSGVSYGVRFVITDNVGQETDTGIVTFNVSYSSPSLIIQADAENVCKDSCIKVSWGNLIQILGTVSGTYSYVQQDYLDLGTHGLHLDSSSILTYTDINMLVNGTLPIFIWTPTSTSFVGLIAEFTNSLTFDSLKIYYDGAKFYQNRNGTILNNLNSSLVSNSSYLIAITGTELHTHIIATY